MARFVGCVVIGLLCMRGIIGVLEDLGYDTDDPDLKRKP